MKALNAGFVKRILNWMHYGLTYGRGDGERGDMCLQHVVARVNGDTKVDDSQDDGYVGTDQPTCVCKTLRDIGIELNDSPLWKGSAARAQGLKRFAIAELGTRSREYKFPWRRFEKLERELRRQEFDGLDEDDIVYGLDAEEDEANRKRLVRYANRLADILIELKTPGSAYICMAEWSATERAKMNDEEKMEAAP